MKKTIAIAVLLLIPSLSFADFDTNLRYGSQGDKVTELQEFLTDQGVYTGPITGNFYALTLKGVKAFQALNDVSPVSGFFGPLTRAVASQILGTELQQSNIEASTTPIITRHSPRPMPDETTPAPQTTNTQAAPTQAPAPTPSAAPTPASQARIDIVFIDDSQDASETYKVYDGNVSRQNTVFLGAVVYDANGDNDRNAQMTIATGDSTQDKTLNGTGNLLNTTGLYYYPFNYRFTQAGPNQITFTADGVSKSITLNAE